jgi:AcrR family transcriptional regulator
MSEPAASRRQRLLDAMADSIAKVGYQQTRVADIVARAQTSRRAFYDYFDDREDCLIALLTVTHRNAIRAIAQNVDPSSPWERQVRQAVESWIAYAETQLPLILTWINEVPSMGPRVQKFRDEVNDAYIKLIQSVSGTEALRGAGYEVVPRGRAIVFIGGLRSLVTMTLQKGGSFRDVTEEAYEAAVSLFSNPNLPQ